MTVGIKPEAKTLRSVPVLAVVFALAAPIVALLHLDRLGVTFCTFKATTGYPCMTCGTTRALGRLAVLDPMGALRVNPLATVAFVAIFVWGGADLVLARSGRALDLTLSPLERHWLLVLAIVLVLGNWAYLIAAGV